MKTRKHTCTLTGTGGNVVTYRKNSGFPVRKITIISGAKGIQQPLTNNPH